MSTITTSPRQGVLADRISGSIISDILVVVVAAGFVGLLAQISFHIAGTPVPVSGQTLGVLVAGATLGTRRATGAMALYAVAGIVGVPWFTDHASGYVGANFGYLLGFIAAAAVMGALSRRGNDRQVVSALGQFVLGSLVIYAFGVSWLAVDLHVSLATAISLGLTPFVVGDIVKALIAGALLPATWRLIGRN